MTVPYTQSVSTARIGGFFRLLFRWRGSIYQVIYGETIIFVILYYVLNLSYRWLMKDTKWQTGFETFAKYCEGFADFIPVTFVLGFYVIHACTRRWTQWENLPWPDKFAFDISGHLVGSDQKTLMLRRTLIRYANLASVLCFRDISIAVRKRLPTMQHVVEAGLMNEAELEQFKKTSTLKDINWWIPFHWAYNLIYRAKIEGKLPEGSANKLQDDVLDMRQKCWVLFSHDWIPIPMVYTQVATLAVYLFMLASLFGRQYVKKEGANHVDLFVPVFPFLQVIFYLGWLKVGEVLTNPFGGDADDFEMNYVIDRNLRLSYTVVDEHYNTVPPIEKDVFWNVEPEVPHTVESSGLRTEGFIGSAASLDKPAQPPDAHVIDGGAAVNRSNSVRTAMRSGRQAIARPLSRLLSRTSDRDRAIDAKLLDSEKGDAGVITPTGSVHGSPHVSPSINRRNRDPNFRNSHPSRLPSIVEGSENLLDLMLSSQEDDTSLLTFASGGSRAGSRVTTPTTDDKSPVSPTVPVIRYSAVPEDEAGEKQEAEMIDSSKETSNEKTPLLTSATREDAGADTVKGPGEGSASFVSPISAKSLKESDKGVVDDDGQSSKSRPLQRRRVVSSLPDISKKTLMERHTSLDL